jgi:hypothetical protein
MPALVLTLLLFWRTDGVWTAIYEPNKSTVSVDGV